MLKLQSALTGGTLLGVFTYGGWGAIIGFCVGITYYWISKQRSEQ